MSIITTKTINDTITNRVSPVSMPGYCILRELSQSEITNDDSSLGANINVLASGTVSYSSLNIPSIISTVIIIPNAMSLVVDHQFRKSTVNSDYISYLNVHGGEASSVHLSSSMCLIKLA